MSFSLNLSSDEEDEKEQQEEPPFTRLLLPESKPAAKAIGEIPTTSPENDDDEDKENDKNNKVSLLDSSGQGRVEESQFSFGFNYDFEDDDDEDALDWEDADDDEEENNDTAGQDIVSTMFASSETPGKQEEKKKRKGKTRRKYGFGSLTQNVRLLVDHLHRASWLALTSHVVFNSKQCSDDLAMAVALSLVPPTFNGGSQPSKKEVHALYSWFHDLVSNAERRRLQTLRFNRRAGAPATRRRQAKKSKMKETPPEERRPHPSPNRLVEYCAYLASSQNEDAQLVCDGQDIVWTSSDKVNLFVTMTRSLGWRVRFAAAIEPISKDVDVNHPVATSFRALASWTLSNQHDKDGKSARGSTSTKKRKRWSAAASSDEQKDLNSLGLSPTRHESSVAGQVVIGWAEVFCRAENGNMRWIHVDPEMQAMDQPQLVEKILLDKNNHVESANGHKKKRAVQTSSRARPVCFVIAAEHLGSDEQMQYVTDVTPRYSSSMSKTLQLRGVPRKIQAKMLSNPQQSTWWSKAIDKLNNGSSNGTENAQPEEGVNSLKVASKPQQQAAASNDKTKRRVDNDLDKALEREKEELSKKAQCETVPTSKDEFNNHPVYVIKSVLKAREVLSPDAKPIAFFKGQCVFLREHVSQALTAQKWLYQHRKVRDCELDIPVKRVEPRKKPAAGTSFQPVKSYLAETNLDDLGMDDDETNDGKISLYAIWQTVPWNLPRVGPDDRIPRNKFGNIEVQLINPGLAHADEPGISQVAKQLGIPYAPCMLGFEGHGVNRKPKFQGVVVHEHNAELLHEAYGEVAQKKEEDEERARKRDIYTKWKRLLVGVLTEDRLEREYG
ncbi:XP-C cells homolog [Seminavis robusta]|uniref:XP-C cells homolog n=1 Tax=Seminavis robusta TaxID=568900 RepID=A0A9N8HAW4_9STRA|nr:XP-C cells homolog [Seminavis robusta]|eukprot:Sro256_g100640.1 XP-C cells homolog (838) ;mRNA; r:36479-39273